MVDSEDKASMKEMMYMLLICFLATMNIHPVSKHLG